MKLLVGLGNPGQEYVNTRHNVGFMFLDYVLTNASFLDYVNGKKFEFDKYSNSQVVTTQSLVLGKPQTFMNNSGQAVVVLAKKYTIPVDDIFVAHDDLDLTLGEYKIQKGVGPKDHNGIIDIEHQLKSKDFWRVRIGVDNRDHQNRIPGEAYVLQKFNNSELEYIESRFTTILDDLLKNYV